MRILFTGASSFTGFWFAKALVAGGHELICPLRRNLQAYEGLRGDRVKGLQSICRLVTDTSFGSDAFLKLIQENGPWDLLCHHAAEVANYRSPDFNPVRATESNTLNLRGVISEMKNLGAKGVVLTGSVFENDEGSGDEPLRAFSSYGLSKALTFQLFRYYCDEARLPLGKFVIPNPFGPWEEPRFTHYLMQSWKDRKAPAVKTPEYVRDNIHADLLALAYARFALRVAEASEGMIRTNPSGYVETQGKFAQRVAREVRTRLGWPCELLLPQQDDFSEPLRRVNTEPAAGQILGWNERSAWDAFSEFYAPGPSCG